MRLLNENQIMHNATFCLIGGVATQKKTERYLKFQIWDWFFSVFFGFFWFFSVFFGFSILANFDWFNGFLLSGSFC